MTRSDFGAYKCVSKNSLGKPWALLKPNSNTIEVHIFDIIIGETEGQIRLYEIASESTVATQSPTEATSRERPVKPTTRWASVSLQVNENLIPDKPFPTTLACLRAPVQAAE